MKHWAISISINYFLYSTSGKIVHVCMHSSPISLVVTDDNPSLIVKRPFNTANISIGITKCREYPSITFVKIGPRCLDRSDLEYGDPDGVRH